MIHHLINEILINGLIFPFFLLKVKLCFKFILGVYKQLGNLGTSDDMTHAKHLILRHED